MSKRIFFDKQVIDMVHGLTDDELKDEIKKVDKMVEQTQDELAEHYAYRDYLYREAFGRTQRAEHEDEFWYEMQCAMDDCCQRLARSVQMCSETDPNAVRYKNAILRVCERAKNRGKTTPHDMDELRKNIQALSNYRRYL